LPTDARPSDETQRIVAIDVVRGVALFGVLAVNLITEFRVSIFQQFLPPTAQPGAYDAAVERAVEFALESKAFALFSLLFGLGLAIQFERLQETGRPSYFLSRRLIALLAFGLLHLLFIWNGDILTEYAIAGLVVLPFLRLSAERLIKGAALCLVIFFGLAFVSQPFSLPSAPVLAQHVTAATNVYANGSYAQIWRFSFDELRLMFPLHVNVFPRTVGLMFLGAGIWKSGLLDGSAKNERVIAVFAVIATAVGFGLAALDAPAIVPRMVAPIVLALGYGALIYAVARVARVAVRPLAAVGRMAFTNYILQSVVFAFVFFGFGAGQFGKMGAASALVLGLATYVAQVVLSTVWLRYYRFGPLEWSWRALMYGQRPLIKPRWRPQ
jgi:uncharacterized protein